MNRCVSTFPYCVPVSGAEIVSGNAICRLPARIAELPPNVHIIAADSQNPHIAVYPRLNTLEGPEG